MSQDSTSFRAEREGDWQRLETMLKRIEGRSPRALSDDDLLDLPLLYRSTLSSLSVGRATSVLFPVFLWLADVVPPRHRTVTVAVFAGLQAFVAVLFFTWRPLF